MKKLMMLGACCSITIVTAIAQEKRDPRPSWIAPRAADTRTNPLPPTQEILAGGRKVFRQRCSSCHAEDGTGTNRGPNLTIQHVQGQSDGALFWKISSGNTRTGMPTFSFLPEAQRWQLVMQVRKLAE